MLSVLFYSAQLIKKILQTQTDLFKVLDDN